MNIIKELIIIGAGGFGRSIFNLAKECVGFGKEYEIKGFIDDNIKALDNFKNYPPIIGTINEYNIQKNDVFVNSVGDIKLKKKCVSIILKKGGEFITLIHPMALILSNAKIGKGCIIDPFVSIGADSIIGDYSLIQNGAVVGHDVKVGKWARIDNYVVLVGGSSVGDNSVVHTGSIINHDVRVHDNATVGAGSFVIKDVKKFTTVYGNPARRL